MHIASAARTSGRCSISVDGRLTGEFFRQLDGLQVNVCGTSWFGRLPTRARIRSRVCSYCFSSGGSSASAAASAASCAATSMPHGIADAVLVAQNIQRLPVDADDFPGGVDLRPRRGLLQRRGYHVGGKRDVGRLQLEALVVGLRLQRFDLRRLRPNTSGTKPTVSAAVWNV